MGEGAKETTKRLFFRWKDERERGSAGTNGFSQKTYLYRVIVKKTF